ncbi:MAG: hypothetical protein ACYDH8_17025 [Syntrophales bacterium]
MKVQGYLPNLIGKTEIIGSDVFKRIFSFQTTEIVPLVEWVAKPDWQGDIVMVVIQGSLYFEDIELPEVVGCTMDYLTLQKDGTAKPFSKMPKLGAQFLPQNMSEPCRQDVEYWAKLGVQMILEYFCIPKQHDEKCFFHAKEYGKATVEDSRLDYCPKCREFMAHLKAPLDFGKLFKKMEKIYGKEK